MQPWRARWGTFLPSVVNVHQVLVPWFHAFLFASSFNLVLSCDLNKNNKKIKKTEQLNLSVQAAGVSLFINWRKFHLWTESRGQDLNYGTIHKHKMGKQSWDTNKVGKNGSAHFMATPRIQSVAAGGKNSQHLQMLVAGCELMPAQ